MLKVLILEDEQYAAAALSSLMSEIHPKFEILAVLEGVQDTLEWFASHAEPDLIIADIHLEDGLSFHIFEHLQLKIPVIFLTAFDEFAIRAFQANSVHYLLKPAELSQLQTAIDKFMTWREKAKIPDWSELLRHLSPEKSYRTRFSVQQGESISFVEVQDIAYFEGDDRYVMLVTRQGKRFIIDYLLRDLENILDPSRFFRLNRSFIAQINAIEGASQLSKSKISVRLQPETKRPISVSAATASAFRKWLDGG